MENGGETWRTIAILASIELAIAIVRKMGEGATRQRERARECVKKKNGVRRAGSVGQVQLRCVPVLPKDRGTGVCSVRIGL